MKVSFLSVFVAVFILITSSCSIQKINHKLPNLNANDKVVTDDKIYFSGGGNEPFWDITISKERISFKSANSNMNLIVPYKIPTVDKETNLKKYNSKSENGELNVLITQGKCSDAMSETEYTYKVELQIIMNGANEFTSFFGCGNYVLSNLNN